MLRAILFCTFLACFASCASTRAPVMREPAPSAEVPEIPGAQHAALAPFVGSFKARVVMEIPGQPQEVSHGNYDVTWMGNMWLVGRYKSDSVQRPFDGVGLVGYDLQSKQYTTWWFDTEHSAPQVSRGIFEPITQQMIMHTEAVHAMPAARVVTKINADGTIKSEVFAPGPEGKEFRVMFIEYTRR